MGVSRDNAVAGSVSAKMAGKMGQPVKNGSASLVVVSAEEKVIRSR